MKAECNINFYAAFPKAIQLLRDCDYKLARLQPYSSINGRSYCGNKGEQLLKDGFSLPMTDWMYADNQIADIFRNGSYFIGMLTIDEKQRHFLKYPYLDEPNPTMPVFHCPVTSLVKPDTTTALSDLELSAITLCRLAERFVLWGDPKVQGWRGLMNEFHVYYQPITEIFCRNGSVHGLKQNFNAKSLLIDLKNAFKQLEHYTDKTAKIQLICHASFEIVLKNLIDISELIDPNRLWIKVTPVMPPNNFLVIDCYYKEGDKQASSAYTKQWINPKLFTLDDTKKGLSIVYSGIPVLNQDKFGKYRVVRCRFGGFESYM